MTAEGPASAFEADAQSASIDIEPPPLPAPQTPARALDRRSVLRHRAFRRVWLAAFVSNCGNWMELIGMQLVVAKLTGELAMAAYLGAAQMVPILLLGTIGGLVADRVDRRRLLLVTQVMLMLVAAAVTVASALDWSAMGPRALPWALITLGGVNACVMAFNMPAWQVLTPRLVPREELTKAITLNGIQFNLARVVGPALGGLVMAWATAHTSWGATPLFAINTLSFLGVVLAVWNTPPAPAPPRDGLSPTRQLTAAASFIFTNKGPLFVFLASVCTSMFAAPLVRFLSQFVLVVYGESKSQIEHVAGAMLSVQGIGAVCGGLALRWLPAWYPRHHFIPMALSGLGLCITAFALCPLPSLGYVVMFFVGVFWIWAFNQTWAAMQNLAPDHMRGRVLAIANTASFGATAIGIALGGVLGDVVQSHFESTRGHTEAAVLGTQAAVGALSVALLCAGTVMLMKRSPEVDGMPAKPRASKSIMNALLAKEHWPK